jgi:hypothetical protein
LWLIVLGANIAPMCSLQISIFISPSGVPHTVQQELKPEKMEQIKVM